MASQHHVEAGTPSKPPAISNGSVSQTDSKWKLIPVELWDWPRTASVTVTSHTSFASAGQQWPNRGNFTASQGC